jgi:hypothetical protein
MDKPLLKVIAFQPNKVFLTVFESSSYSAVSPGTYWACQKAHESLKREAEGWANMEANLTERMVVLQAGWGIPTSSVL